MNTDILIQGGGFAGLTLALLAALAGKNVVVVDQASVPERVDGNRDVRTVAISAGSKKILERAGVWRSDRFPMCPITDIQILDGDGPEIFLEFGAHEVGGEAFGHIIDNIDLRRALIEDVAAQKNIAHIMQDSLDQWRVDNDRVQATTKKGVDITAQLLIGADGKNSDIRKQAGIGQFGWSYKESALVVTIHHEHPHQNIAIERFRSDGPFAVLPMMDDENNAHRSAIVWTLPNTHSYIASPAQAGAQTIDPSLRWDSEKLKQGIQTLLPAFYGAITHRGKAQSFPLSLQNTYSMVGDRVALIADAGHVMHPIAGQGLNVGLRDVVQLADLMASYEDVGSAELLRRYDRARKMDVTAMMVFTDKLNRLFGTKFAPVRMARRFGLETVAATPALKQFFMKRAMGY